MSSLDPAAAPVYLTVKEAALRARCNAETVRRALRSGELRGWLFLNQWRTTADDVDEWMRRYGPGKGHA